VSATAVELLGEGRVAVRGPLRFATVPGVWRAARTIAADAPRLTVDLAGVTEADSAALALLVEWMREARQRGAEVHFAGMPRQLEAIVRVSGLDGLLP
jgi:phospholipid transport system transporter-binding protein